MKNKKSIIQKVSEFGILIIIIVGMFSFFKYKWDTKKAVPAPAPEIVTISEEKTTTPPPVIETAPEQSPEPTPVQNTLITTEEVKVTPEKKLDPLLVKITNFYNGINEKYEQRLRDMFKSEQKEEFMDKYLALRQERTMRMRDLLKTDNSRASNLRVNYEYHNKLYAIIGKDLYIKYLKILKETNDDAKKTKIVLEF